MRRTNTSTAILIGGAVLAAAVVSSTPVQSAPAIDRSAAAYRTREITVPAGTVLRLRLRNAVGSDLSRTEDPVSATLATSIRLNGRDVLPAGSIARGYVTSAVRSGKVKGRARLGLRFSTIVLADDHERYNISTRQWVAVAPATKRSDAMKIGLPALGGALVGGLVGGGKGAAIGGAAGGGAGTAVVLTTRGKEVRIGRGAIVKVRLASPVMVRVDA
jgi:hypothetical protein